MMPLDFPRFDPLDSDDPPLRVGGRLVRLHYPADDGDGPALDTSEHLADRRVSRPERMPVLRTEGQRRRFRRNLVIAAAHRQGVSQRVLAEVFDLPRSRIGEIVAEVAALTSGGPLSPES